jgi:cytochrome-b5 reductase
MIPLSGKGHLTKQVLKAELPEPSDDNMVFVCGPRMFCNTFDSLSKSFPVAPMVKAISGSKAPDYSQGEVDGLLKELGYTSKNVFKF